MLLLHRTTSSRKSSEITPTGLTQFHYPSRKAPVILLVVLLMLSTFSLALFVPATTQAEDFASPSFKNTWAHSDLPVAQQVSHRSFVYGPQGFFNTYEPYTDSPNGVRLVQYFDKARMEITQPGNNPNNLYYVTNGLLVKEMVSGNLQLGDRTFKARYPAYDVPVAGDPVNNPSPTYASFTDVATTQVSNPYINPISDPDGNVPITPNPKNGKVSEPHIGLPVGLTMGKNGQVDSNSALGSLTTYAYYDQTLGHNIAKPFWDFFNQKGIVFDNGNPVQGLIFNWVYTVGYPITEPYWVVANVNGVQKDVLVQLFERRVLTWTPSNQVDYQVEMGNVGLHYYTWRYDPKYDIAVTPPSLATINPSAGFPGTRFVIQSTIFTPGETIDVTVVQPGGKVTASFDTVTANAKGELLYVISTAFGAQKGQYSLIFDSQKTGNRATVYFKLIGIPGVTE